MQTPEEALVCQEHEQLRTCIYRRIYFHTLDISHHHYRVKHIALANGKNRRMKSYTNFERA
jgi:hypothetical protein